MDIIVSAQRVVVDDNSVGLSREPHVEGSTALLQIPQSLWCTSSAPPCVAARTIDPPLHLIRLHTIAIFPGGMAALQVSSSVYSSLDRRCTTSGLSHETGPARYGSSIGRVASKATSCVRVVASEVQDAETETTNRRQVLGGAAALVATLGVFDNTALAAKAPKGYAAVLDNADGYQFFYPFGWQEVAVKGQDIAFKDVIEPLESVSVSIIKTDKGSLEELGSPDEVAKALVEKVLASPTQKTQLVEAKERSEDGKTYYQFEFLAKASNFTRHGLGTVAIKDGKFFTLTTGANERRWNKMSDKLKAVINSFQLLT